MKTWACECGAEATAVEVLDRATLSLPDLGVLVSRCARCGRGVELVVRDGTLDVGWTYWAGSLHFEGGTYVEAPGLRVERRRDPPRVTATLGGRVWRFEVPPGPR